MRQLFTITALLFFLHSTGQTKRNLESKIEKVTVFREGAQVQRTVRISIPAGKQELIFANISPLIDKQSIQVKADGNNLTVLSVIHQLNYLKLQQKQDEIIEVEAQKEAQLEKIALQENILNVFKQEEALLVKNQEIGGTNNGLKAADLKEAADFQRSRLSEVYQKQMETERLIKKMKIELARMNKQLTELNQKVDISTSEIHVTVVAKEPINSNFMLTYLVKQAGWFPTYDIRVKDISSPIHLQYKANTFQSSGEDWKDVKLFLSTGNPNENGTRPSINPWFLGFASPALNIRGLNAIQSNYRSGSVTGMVRDEKGLPVSGASITIKGARTGTTADSNGLFSIALPDAGGTLTVSAVGYEPVEFNPSSGAVTITLKQSEKQLAEVVVTGYGMSGRASGVDLSDENETGRSYKRKKEASAIVTNTTYQPTTTVYEIEDPYTILNDGKTYMVDIDGYEVMAKYEYYAAPKLVADAFLTAKIVDWQDLNLLPGEANLFFEGTFLGKSLLDIVNAEDTLNLSLGKDKGVVVKRTLVKDFSSKKFWGSNRTDTRHYEIAVRNNKQQPINIIVEDQFPVSTLKEIEVQDREYQGARLDNETQKLTWVMVVDSKKENKLHFRYEVKYPRDKVLQLE